jgi:hypothetical protein
MSRVLEMLQSHPRGVAGVDQAKLAECIEACFECAQVCTACAEACVAEDMVAELRQCIRTNLDCADVCAATGSVLVRRGGADISISAALLEACRIACQTCGRECQRHAGMHEHCRVCAEVCHRCEVACARLLSDLG